MAKLKSMRNFFKTGKRCPRCHVMHAKNEDYCRVCYQLNDAEVESLKASISNQKKQIGYRTRLFIFISFFIGLLLIYLA